MKLPPRPPQAVKLLPRDEWEIAIDQVGNYVVSIFEHLSGYRWWTKLELPNGCSRIEARE